MFEDRLEPVLEVARAHAAEVDRAGVFPHAAVEALRGSGLLGLTLPVEHKGLGAGPVEFVDVLASVAGACGSTAMVYLMHAAAGMCVAAAPPRGMPDVVTDLATGEQLGSLAFSETGSRSHFWAPVSKAEAEGDGVRIRASKSFVTSAGHADVYVVSTLAPGDAGPTDVDLYAVPSSTERIEVGGLWVGMGLRGNASAPVAFDAAVPASHRIGGRSGGFGLMMQVVLPWFNLGNAAVSVGLAAAATDGAIAHACAARFENSGEALADLPTIRARLARMRIGVELQRSYLGTAASSVAVGNGEAMLHVLGVKAAANEAALSVTDEAMRVCGGAAFSRALSVERHFRDARAGHVMAPTADVLYEFYGRSVTGRPLF